MWRKEEGRGLASIEDSVDASIKQLENYVEKRGGRLTTATRNDTDNGRNSKTEITRKQLYGRFKWLTSDILHEKTWTCLRKGNLKRETESLLIAQNNAVRINHIKARIDTTQQNSRCWLCGDRHETINHIISESSKLAQKEYKTRQDCMGKVIYWELCKKFKFDHTNKWYMHNPTSVLENDTHILLWDFDMQTEHLMNQKERACRIVGFTVLVDHRVKLKEAKRRISTLTLQKELKHGGTWKWRLYRL